MTQPKTSIFITTSGRYDVLAVTMGNFRMACGYDFDQKFIVNDSPDKEFQDKLMPLADYFGYTIIHNHNKKGFSGAYNTAFNNIAPDSDYCFILEDDFTFNERVNIKAMIGLLKNHPYLCQVALKRQAWAEAEKVAGGICEQWPDLYEDQETDYGIQWTEHRNFFTTNPCLIPAWVFKQEWPVCARSEEVFGKRLFEDAEVKSCFYGHKFDQPRVTHIGENRNGTGY